MPLLEVVNMPKLKAVPLTLPPVQEPVVPRISLSVAEAAESVGLSVSHLYTLMGEGRLRFTKIGARRLIPIAELQALVALPPVA
jgi:excisionase family DNA binding protein